MAGAFAYGMTPTNSPKGSAFQAVQPSAIPVGVIEMFAGSTAPNGWLVVTEALLVERLIAIYLKSLVLLMVLVILTPHLLCQI